MPSFLYNELESSGFVCQEPIPNVLLIENFLSKSEVDEINNIIQSISEEDWRKEYVDNLKRFCMEKFNRDDVDNLVAEGKFEITKNWEDKNFNIVHYPIYRQMHPRLNNLVTKVDDTLELSGFATIQRMQPRVELKAHTDMHTDPSIKYAAILYINDDYVDGELFFPNKDFSIRPTPGSLLIFPGNEEFEHGVKHVGNGPIRYVIVGFIKTKDFYKHNKY